MDSEARARDLLEGMLLDANAEPTYMPLSLLNSITNNFSNDRQIGSGGFAIVYKGSLQNGIVAVKKLIQTLDVHETKFHQEVDSLMRVKHKNIVRFLGYCSDTQGKVHKFNGRNVMAEERQRFLCFEFMPEGSLDKYISDASRGLEWMTRYQIIKGICEGLHYLHQKQIVHLDLKPANILLDHCMVPKISDFGLSRCFDEKQTRAMTSNVFGTQGYMAPEFYGGLITLKSDIYSLGIIIIEILTGQKGYLEIENVLESWTARFGTLLGDTRLEPIRVCAEIGMECLDFNPAKRPVTSHIIERLAEMERTYGFIKTDLFITSSFATNVEQIGKIDKVDNPPSESTGSDNEVKLETMARINSIPFTRHDEFPVLVRLTAPLRCTENSRVALDLVAVIDVSESMMTENRLESVKMAMMFVIDNLGPNDRLSVVSYNERAQQCTKLSNMSKDNREVTRHVVLGLVAGGGDDVPAAIEKADKILRQRGPEERINRAGRIILLSDGEYALSEIDQYMGCEFPVGTFSFGPFGTSHDPCAFYDLAYTTMGVYSYVIEDPEEIEAAFAMSLGGLMSIIATDVQVELQTFGGVTISSIDSGSFYNIIDYDGRSGTIHVKDLYAGEQKNFIVYLTVRKRNVQKLMTASGCYKSPMTATIQIDASEVVVQRTAATTPSEENEAVCPDVAAELARMTLVKYVSFAADSRTAEEVYALQSRWAEIKGSLDGLSAPRSALIAFDKDVATMQHVKEGKPFMLSWLTSHLLQRATTKGSSRKSSAFRVKAMEEKIKQVDPELKHLKIDL